MLTYLKKYLVRCMKKRQRKKEMKKNKDVYVPLIPVEVFDKKIMCIQNNRGENQSNDRCNLYSSTCDGICISDEFS